MVPYAFSFGFDQNIMRYQGSVKANIWYVVVSEKLHHFWELLHTNLLSLFEVAGKNSIFPILVTTNMLE